jgi:hypothetical protein
MMIALFWIGGMVVVGILANRFNRNAAGWVVLALCISPLLAGVIILACGRKAPPTFGYGVKKIQHIKNREAWQWCADDEGRVARYTSEQAVAFAAQWNAENRNPNIAYKAQVIGN